MNHSIRIVNVQAPSCHAVEGTQTRGSWNFSDRLGWQVCTVSLPAHTYAHGTASRPLGAGRNYKSSVVNHRGTSRPTLRKCRLLEILNVHFATITRTDMLVGEDDEGAQDPLVPVYNYTLGAISEIILFAPKQFSGITSRSRTSALTTRAFWTPSGSCRIGVALMTPSSAYPS